MKTKATDNPTLLHPEMEYQLDGMNSKERLSALDDAIHMLQFHRRYAELDHSQRAHFEGHLSKESRDAINKLKGKEREDKINEFARALYFRQCAWISYLNGERKEPPCLPVKINQ